MKVMIQMKLKLFISMTLMLCFYALAHSQSMNVLNYVNELGDKKQASFGDAVKLIVLDMGENTSGFESDLSVLNARNKIAAGYSLSENAPLRKGVVARLIARYLRLTDSLVYNIFGTERYAFRACVAADIMIADGSEWDYVSGEELLEIMRRVAVISGI